MQLNSWGSVNVWGLVGSGTWKPVNTWNITTDSGGTWKPVNTWNITAGSGTGQIGIGWPNSCGIELFTLGWIGCDDPVQEIKYFWITQMNKLLGGGDV